jgi:autophagy-related protein 9
MPTTPPTSSKGRPPDSNANSLLNLLNPYASASISRSLYAGRHAEPESPSTMLLRELQGEGEGDGERSKMEDIDEERERYIPPDRDGLSPTPTPSHRRPSQGRGTMGNPTTTTNISSSSDEEGDQPPRSLLYDVSGRPKSSRQSRSRNPETSPGPFKPAHSSSTDSMSQSRSRSRSESTSPGPSTISNYASGLEATNLEPSAAASTSASTSMAKSPSPPISTAVSPVRHVPTFREVPRPKSPVRAVSGSSKRGTDEGSGYLDPPLSSSTTRKGKGKGKARTTGGRRYHQVATGDQDGESEEEGKAPAKIGKQGLNEYEKALWQWVNVDDLDGFLQEVSCDG